MILLTSTAALCNSQVTVLYSSAVLSWLVPGPDVPAVYAMSPGDVPGPESCGGLHTLPPGGEYRQGGQ